MLKCICLIFSSKVGLHDRFYNQNDEPTAYITGKTGGVVYQDQVVPVLAELDPLFKPQFSNSQKPFRFSSFQPRPSQSNKLSRKSTTLYDDYFEVPEDELSFDQRGLIPHPVRDDYFIFTVDIQLLPVIPASDTHLEEKPTSKNFYSLDLLYKPLRVGLLFLLVGLITFALRAININQSFDLFMDEIVYFHISQNFANGFGIELFDQPFFVHPPAFFLFEGTLVKILPLAADIIHQVYEVRFVNVFFASISALAITAIARRIAGWQAGLLAVLIFALDPFIIKMDSHNMLETSALCWLVLGYWLLVSPKSFAKTDLVGPVWHPEMFRKSIISNLVSNALSFKQWLGKSRLENITWYKKIGAGICFGLALLTKDMAAFLTILPLIICFILGIALSRRTCLIVSLVCVLTYLPYPISTLIFGTWDQFIQQKFHGIVRLIGVVQETGLNRPNAPSLIETLINRLSQYGTTYALLGLGIGAIFVLMLYGNVVARLVAVWTLSTYGLLAYCVVLGTLEDQFFHLLVIPALLSVGSASVLLLKRRTFIKGPWFPKAYRISGSILLGIFLFWSTFQWVNIHFSEDNGYEKVLNYIHQNLPPHTSVTASSFTSQILLNDYGINSGPWDLWYKVEELKEFRPEYLLLTTYQLKWDHGNAAEPLENWVNQHGILIFSYTSKVTGPLLLYYIPPNAYT